MLLSPRSLAQCVTLAASFVSVNLAHASAPSGLTSDDQRAELMRRFVSGYDTKQRGWTHSAKPIDPATIELAIQANQRGEISTEAMAQKNLMQAIDRIDPQWGGIYAGADEYEKLAADQARSIRTYALANAAFGSSVFLAAARAIDAYVEATLTSPEGAFFTAQSGRPAKYFELDDEGRRAEGVPEVERSIITSDNGAMIEALATLYAVTGDPSVLDRAIRAAEWILARRKLPGGGFKSDDTQHAHLELADALAMGRGMLELFAATSEEKWLAESEDAAMFIARTFSVPGGGFSAVLTACELDDCDAQLAASREPGQNIEVVRFANLLYRYTDAKEYRRLAQHAMRYVVEPGVLQHDDAVAGAILADRELAKEPVRTIIVGDRTDPRALSLHHAALSRGGAYRLIEWVEPGPAPLRYAAVDYARPRKAAVIMCANGQCGAPIYEASRIRGLGASR